MAGSASHSAPAGQAAGNLPANTSVGSGRYIIDSLLHRGPLAEIYHASDTTSGDPVSIHLIDPKLAAAAPVRDAVVNAARAAFAIDHKNVARTLDVVSEDGRVFVVSELIEGNPLRELLDRKRDTGGAGFGVRGAGNIIGGVCNALAASHATVAHGGIGTNSVFVNKAGRVKVVGFGVGAAHPAAAKAGLLPAADIAPDTARSGVSSPAGDVFSVGRLLYEVLLGYPLKKGGTRPSQAIEELTSAVDEVMGRCCAGGPDSRIPSGELKAAIAEALSKRADPKPRRDSLQQAIAGPVSAAQSAQMPAQSGPMAAQSGSMPATGSGAFAAQSSGAHDNPALADTEEKWLVSKGKLDFGPFGLAHVVEQIRTNEIQPGHFIVDNHTGERWNVEEHPLLTRLVDQAKQRRDDQRRAQAEVHHAKSEKTRGFALYLFIAAGVAAVAVVAYLVVTGATKAKEEDSGDRLASVGESDIAVKVSAAKKSKPAKKRSGKRSGKRSSKGGGGGGGGDTGGDENDVLALDMNSDLGTETLSMGTVNQHLRSAHGSLGRCMSKTGERYAAINFIIKGPTGRVVWVRVNGKKSGALYSCIKSALKRVKFPTVDGPRTKAEFDISL
jgi:hypothetical protein